MLKPPHKGISLVALLGITALIFLGGFMLVRDATKKVIEDSLDLGYKSDSAVGGDLVASDLEKASARKVPISAPPEISNWNINVKENITENYLESDKDLAEGTGVQRVLAQTSNVPKSVNDPDKDCFGTNEELYACYGNFYTAKVANSGIASAMQDIKERYSKNNWFIISQCHQMVHIIGRAATRVYPTVAEAYNHGDSFCWSGYYHGVMEGIIAQTGLKDIENRLNVLCKDLPGALSYSFDYFNCVHGLGHGFMFITNHELFESLEYCDGLEGKWEQESCYGGVFMENIIVNNIDHVTKYLRDDDPHYPCNAVDNKYKNSCYLMQTSRMLDMNGGNFADVFRICAEVAEPFVNICYQSLGRDASGRSVSDAVRTKSTCELGPDERAQKNCLIGAVKDFVSYHHSDVQARELCGYFEGELADTCIKTINSYYASF